VSEKHRQRHLSIPLDPRVTLDLIHDLNDRKYLVAITQRSGPNFQQRQVAKLNPDEALQAARFLAGINDVEVMKSMLDEEKKVESGEEEKEGPEEK
jgi:hypothetical protein